MNNEDSV